MGFGNFRRGRGRGVRAAALGLLASLRSLHAAEPAPGALTLAGAQQRAFEQNWDQLSARRDVAIADAHRLTAREFTNPTLSTTTTHISTDGRGNAGPGGNKLWDRSYDTIVSLSQPLEIGGKRASRQASAAAAYEAAQAQFADARRTLDVAVARAYVAAALADETVTLTSDSATHLRREAELAAIRLNAGDIAQSELAQIEIAARQLELQAQTARAGAVAQRIALEALLGFPQPRGDVAIADRLETLAAAAPLVVPEREISRPDRVVAEQTLRKAEADLRAQKAQRIPDPTLFVQYEHQPPDAPNTVGLGVSFPLPLWSRNHGGIRAASFAREQAELSVNKIKAQIVADVAAARAGYDEALSRWREYDANVRPRAERVRESVSLAYEKGGASLLDLLQAQRNANDVRLAAAQAAADTIVARVALQAATTELTPNSRAQP